MAFSKSIHRNADGTKKNYTIFIATVIFYQIKTFVVVDQCDSATIRHRVKKKGSRIKSNRVQRFDESFLEVRLQLGFFGWQINSFFGIRGKENIISKNTFSNWLRENAAWNSVFFLYKIEMSPKKNHFNYLYGWCFLVKSHNLHLWQYQKFNITIHILVIFQKKLLSIRTLISNFFRQRTLSKIHCTKNQHSHEFKRFVASPLSQTNFATKIHVACHIKSNLNMFFVYANVFTQEPFIKHGLAFCCRHMNGLS